MVLVRKVALWGLPAVEAHDVLHMVCVGEHVDGLHGGDAVGRIEKGQIACLRCGVAADVDYALGCGAQYDLDDAGVDTARGGSRIMTSGWPLRAMKSSLSTSFMSPA